MSGIGESGTNLAMSGGEQATTKDTTEDKDLRKIAKWVAEITLYDREARSWYNKVKKIQRRYKDERSAAENSVARFNALWSNVQTLLPALYARNPKPDIQRRFKDADPVGRVASDVLERCVGYFVDTDHFAATVRQTVLDYLLGGRGTVWIRYVPHMRTVALEVTDDSEENEEHEGLPEPPEVIDYEEVLTDYVHADDFGHNICRTWEELYCVWRKVYMTRAEQVKRFGKEKGNLAPLDYKQKDSRDNTVDNGVGKSTIYELWDKERDCAVWFHKDIPEALDLRHDPLELDGFFPCPKPLYATLANDSLIPVPDYIEYQDQAVELDTLTGRIVSTIKSAKVAGAYDASAPALGRILSEGIENQLTPVDNWASLTEKGGLSGILAMLPIGEITAAIQAMYEAREQTKNDLYEITGIADIIRGQSEPEETLGAQQIKSNFATQRISDRQREVQRFVREIIRIMVDVICGHFQLDTIKTISGVRLLSEAEKLIYQPSLAVNSPAGNGAPAPASTGPGTPGAQTGAIPLSTPAPPPLPKWTTPDQMENMLADPSWEDVNQLIRNNALRCFRIDIETDSTIKADEEAEKASRSEFVKALGELISQAEQAPPDLLPFLVQVVQWYSRAFPVGKDLESAMNALVTKLEKQAQAAAGQPKPDPAMEKVKGEQMLAQSKQQADAQLQQAKMQADIQTNNAKIQGELQLEHAKLQAKQASDASEAQQAAITDQRENELEAAREKAKLEQEERIAMARIAAETDMRLRIAHIDAAAKIEVARITAKYDKGDEAEAREASGE